MSLTFILQNRIVWAHLIGNAVLLIFVYFHTTSEVPFRTSSLIILYELLKYPPVRDDSRLTGCL